MVFESGAVKGRSSEQPAALCSMLSFYILFESAGGNTAGGRRRLTFTSAQLQTQPGFTSTVFILITLTGKVAEFRQGDEYSSCVCVVNMDSEQWVSFAQRLKTGGNH